MQKVKIMAFILCAIALSVFMPVSASGQYDDSVSIEMRPFDFEDSYYEKNGVNPKMIINRRTGFDKYSVVDFTNSDKYRDVRITGIWPMSDYKGAITYVAPLGEFGADGFMRGKEGAEAIEIAHRYPYFVFPSANFKNRLRQSEVAETGLSYFEKNPLGLSVMVSVEYTKKGASKEGQAEIEFLLGKNGKTLDGTLAIRRVSEINYLTWRGYVTQQIHGPTGKGEAVYKINNVIQDPTRGAISPDANLNMVLDDNRVPISSEMVFFEQFGCLQKNGSWCG